MSLSGLAQLTCELTSRCDKRTLCGMCGHQNETINTALKWGDIDFDLLRSIREQVEPGIIISFHHSGEPTAYPRLRDALELFRGFTTSLVTHGLNLESKAEDIIGNCTTITISVFRGDPDYEPQLRSLQAFLQAKGSRSPQVQIKIVGDLSEKELQPYEALGVRIIKRLIHVPILNSKYAHRAPTVPEVGICLDALHRPTIDFQGSVYLCNRLDPQRHGLLGNLAENTLEEIWNGEARTRMLNAHAIGRRDLANPLCAKCTFWGVASE